MPPDISCGGLRKFTEQTTKPIGQARLQDGQHERTAGATSLLWDSTIAMDYSLVQLKKLSSTASQQDLSKIREVT